MTDLVQCYLQHDELFEDIPYPVPPTVINEVTPRTCIEVTNFLEIEYDHPIIKSHHFCPEQIAFENILTEEELFWDMNLALQIEEQHDKKEIQIQTKTESTKPKKTTLTKITKTSRRKRGTTTCKRKKKEPEEEEIVNKYCQHTCCITGCANSVKNRLKESLKLKHWTFKEDHIEKDWRRICAYHYFSDNYAKNKQR